MTIRCLLAASVLASTAAADDIHVPGDAPTIQQAIDIAFPGDRVLVQPGIYPETIEFRGKAITVLSTDGPDATTIDAGGQETFVVSFISGETRDAALQGFTITGGLGATRGNQATGGGVRIDGAAPTITDCLITGNTGLNGGGLTTDGGDPLVADTRFEANTAFNGGALGALGGAVTIERCTFTDNTATLSGGALAILAADAAIRDAAFSRNLAGDFGGAIFANHADLDASGLDVADNGDWQDLGGGSRLFNTAGGGGIYTTGTNGSIEASVFRRNGAFAGGGVYIAGAGTIRLVNCLVVENITALGGVYANSSSPAIINSTIADNETFGLFTTYNAFPTVDNTVFTGQTNVASTEIAGNGAATVRYSLIDGDAFGVNLREGVVRETALLDADYAPRAGSPAIDAGDNAAVPAGVTSDLAGNNRFFDDPETDDTGSGQAPIVDMGAFEFGSTGPACPGDANGDGEHDTRDVAHYLNLWTSRHPDADINSDGSIDTRDFLEFLNIWNAGC